MRTLFVFLSMVAAIYGAEPHPDIPEPNREFLETHCIQCHGPKKSKGGIRLDQLAPAFSSHSDAEIWLD